MGCGGCSSGKSGGCGSGGCSSGGCNRLNVYDWLSNMPIDDLDNTCNIIELSFEHGSRKDFYRNSTSQFFYKGDLVTVEGVNGFDVGEVSLQGELVRLQMKKKKVNELSADIKKILRRSNEHDIALFNQNKAKERSMLIRSREVARDLKLQMKLSQIEIQADGRKATFFYTADERVDFRELIKSFASEFKLKVEMRQIGVRQEAAKIGGIGSCGRELCCSTWMSEFKSVNTTAARYQNLSINQAKLSGQCGRLKCCLNFELDTYLDALQHFPHNADSLETQRGRAQLVKKDIFKDLMWYTLPDSNKQYTLTLHRVKEIQQMNMAGEKPETLQAVEIISKVKDTEPGFVDVVGQISLRSLEKGRKQYKSKNQHNNNARQKQQTQAAGRNTNSQQQGGRAAEYKKKSGNSPQEQNNNRNNRNFNNDNRPKRDARTENEGNTASKN